MQSKGPFYQVPTGRRDGLVSNVADAADMPDLPDSVAVMKAKFAEKGLSEKDLVLLSGKFLQNMCCCNSKFLITLLNFHDFL